MTGPDSDRWPSSDDRSESWNWQSDSVCVEAETLCDRGADDDEVVMAVGRYAIEQLILNAVHEIGEWLRFDGHRLFAPHPTNQEAAVTDRQGNGPVHVTVTFTPPARPLPTPPSDAKPGAPALVGRLTDLADASRFTYLPGTAVRFLAAGPSIQMHTPGRPTAEWTSRWSEATLAGLRTGADRETLIGLVQRDVHGALVDWEAEQTCRTFYLDRRRPWRLSGLDPLVSRTSDTADAEEVNLFISYADSERAAA